MTGLWVQAGHARRIYLKPVFPAIRAPYLDRRWMFGNRVRFYQVLLSTARAVSDSYRRLSLLSR